MALLVTFHVCRLQILDLHSTVISMKKIYFLLFLIINVLIGEDGPAFSPLLEDRYSAAKPTIYLYLRGAAFRELSYDWKDVVRSASSSDDCLSHEIIDGITPWDSLVVIDEVDYWVVAFHLLGNGQLVNKSENPIRDNLRPAFLENPTLIVYLDKVNLKEISQPKGAINFSPIVLD